MNTLKKYSLAIITVLGLGSYVLWSSRKATPVVVTLPGNPPSTSTAAGQDAYKNGTYTGVVADAIYGPMQVSAVIQGGRLVDVQFLQYPQDRGESRQINSVSNPILRQEAIQAQSARVNIISGATQSSEAFAQSLNSALVQAQS